MLSFFDCEMAIGMTGFDLRTAKTPAELLAVMDRYAISDALVYDRGAYEMGRFDRHDFILEFCAASPRLHPTICIVPPATGEQPEPEALVGFCLAHGVRAVRAWPVAHGFPFDRYALGRLLAELERHRMPVIVSAMNVQDHPWLHAPPWRDIRDTALAFPKLPILVHYTGMLQGRSLFPLLETCPNVLADLTCTSFQYVEEVAARFGSERLVFASHFPQEDPGYYACWVNYCGLDEAGKRNVAGDNIRRLLEEVR
ncbi:MAG: amidohydrolase family protein [Armatimonadota bacterium]